MGISPGKIVSPLSRFWLRGAVGPFFRLRALLFRVRSGFSGFFFGSLVLGFGCHALFLTISPGEIVGWFFPSGISPGKIFSFRPRFCSGAPWGGPSGLSGFTFGSLELGFGCHALFD